ncbi:glutamine synthetase family protein [Amphritea sp. 2_MG-2023]|uniref:glutamine synthetase family protein n=1 Tax=Amphritea TaxID=515417 RepID=UPI001C079DAF|nr:MULTISPECIES: glutamine synthetase family protein [Amphritea]MBU2967323.1 glutamine synthetase family protein [Amphritea atlantica]MDO6420471.1 glutamine synthetase family protein [Amphritea sp. 2_MG-2023]
MEPFIEKYGLWTTEQSKRADEILKQIESSNIKNIRVGWGDQHGIVRGKTVTASHFVDTMKNGKDFQLVTAIFDTTNHPIVPPFGAENHLNIPEMIGLPDGILVPDPMTFKVLPWVEDTAWILADAYLTNGAPCPLSTRQILRDQLTKLANDGLAMTVGLELEFYIFKLLDPKLSPVDSGYPPAPPEVEMISHGYQYLTENRGDEVVDIMTYLQENLEKLDLPVATLEDEWGPGQCEITFDPLPAMEAADAALLVRTAIKQLCRRKGFHASFMAKPKVPNIFPSGWHMHQSITSTTDGSNVFVANEGEGPLSKLGMQYLGGLLKHANATSMLTTPTINGYKRQAPDGFAPFKAAWALENRGAMLRVIGGPGDPASRIENRIGEPTANPYLYIASQVIAGRSGILTDADPGQAVKAAYLADRPLLPKTLMEASAAFLADESMREEFGETVHNYLYKLKEFEIDRFMSEVTDWEEREYFEIY